MTDCAPVIFLIRSTRRANFRNLAREAIRCVKHLSRSVLVLSSVIGSPTPPPPQVTSASIYYEKKKEENKAPIEALRYK